MMVLLRKGIATLTEDGPLVFLQKTGGVVRRNVRRLRRQQELFHFKDVLFVNGCALPHPSRYRVDHQIEQLHFSGFSCDSVFYEDLNLDLLRYHRAFVFFRCPHTPMVETFIAKAKACNKLVLFDVDDLVIDEKYVRDIKYLQSISGPARELYMDGVRRMQRTLKLCDGAITTTERLAMELKGYVPDVFVNRNVASEKMVELSEKALRLREARASPQVVLGYFSGSITHNDDFRMILPSIVRVLERLPQAALKIVGFLDVPPELQPFRDRISVDKFVDWKNLPELIAGIDVNLAPLEDSVFNEAKSENKWVEASLVGVPTVASPVGPIASLAKHGDTGFLCRTADDWVAAISTLVESKRTRDEMGRRARDLALANCVTAHTAGRLAGFLRSKLPPGLAFVLPSVQVSGGVNVVTRHGSILQKRGVDVTLLSMGQEKEPDEVAGLPVVHLRKTAVHAYFDRGVATLWSTVGFVNTFPKFKSRYYLVQGYETDFYHPGDARRIYANLTYTSFSDIHYVTISKWCQSWLSDKFGQEARYAPNGIDLRQFTPAARDFSGRIRVLIEGSSDDPYKNVDESFRITNQLDPARFEVWYLSYKGKPKEWYRVDKFLHHIPYQGVADVYRSCHLLVKSSRRESFSYPPLEMMSTGGIAIVAPNSGNVEYLRDRENCLMYPSGEIQRAVRLIEEACGDESLRAILIRNGLATAEARDWRTIQADIPALYGL